MRPPRDRPGARRISQLALSKRCSGVSRGFAVGRRCGGIEAHGQGVHLHLMDPHVDGDRVLARVKTPAWQLGRSDSYGLTGWRWLTPPQPLRPFGTVLSRFHGWLWLPLSLPQSSAGERPDHLKSGQLQQDRGPVTVTVSPTNVVTVHLTPVSATTWVIGIPVSFPPGPPNLAGYARSTINTAGGVVTIDTVVTRPGPPSRFRLPNLAVISIHPPSPCRAQTVGSTVTFTPIATVVPG